MAWYSRLGAFSGVTWHAGVVSGGVWWGSSMAVTLRMRLATAVTWCAVGGWCRRKHPRLAQLGICEGDGRDGDDGWVVGWWW